MESFVSLAIANNAFGHDVKFITTIPSNKLYITGKVVGIVDYTAAKGMADIDAFNASASPIVSSLKNKFFIVVKTTTQEGTDIRRPYCLDWILSSKFEVLSNVDNYTLELSNVTVDELNALITYATNNGLSVKVT